MFSFLGRNSLANDSTYSFTGDWFEGGPSFTALGLGFNPSGVSTNRFAIGAVIQANYFFKNEWGISMGAQYITRGAELISGNDSSATFLDFPLSLQIPLGVSTFQRSQTFLGLGTYFSMPLSNLTSGADIKQKTKKTMGALVEVSHLVAIGENSSIGLRLRNMVSLFPVYEPSLVGPLERTFDLIIQASFLVRL